MGGLGIRRTSVSPSTRHTSQLTTLSSRKPIARCIREGERTIELPAIQAAVRALAISAMKGSRLSQRALAELVRTVEERKSTEHQTALENAFEYQRKWTAELERRRSPRDYLLAQLGEAPPTPAILAGRAPGAAPDRGAIVCACFDVGLKTILAAIAEQDLADVAAIGAALGAGTNCGSCRPALAKLLPAKDAADVA